MATQDIANRRVQTQTKNPTRTRDARMAQTALLYILPAFLAMALITFWPLIFQFWMSFTNYSNRNLRTDNLLLQMVGSFTGNPATYNSPEFLGLANYTGILFGELARVLSGFDFWRILLFNLVWTVVNLVFHVAIGVAIAILLNQDKLKFKRLYRALYIIPWAMPALVSAMVWRNMFDDQSGAVNQLMGAFGLADGTRWLQQVDAPFPWLPPFIQVPAGANPFLILFVFLLLLIAPYFLAWVRERWLKFTIVWIIGLQLFFWFALTPLLNLFAGASGQTIRLGLGELFPLAVCRRGITD